MVNPIAEPSCHSLTRLVAGARWLVEVAIVLVVVARLAAINRSVLINLLIIDAIMCLICEATTGAWGNIRRRPQNIRAIFLDVTAPY